MMSYAAIDPQITAWTDRHGLTLFREWADCDARFCYTSSESECFQIAIREPQSDQVQIEAFSIETANDEDFQQSWQVPVTNIEKGLEDALATVENWKRGIDRPNASGSAAPPA